MSHTFRGAMRRAFSGRRRTVARHAVVVLVAASAVVFAPASLLAQAGAGAVPAAVDAAALQELDKYVAQAVRDWNIPGLAIAVVAGDRVVFKRGYGVREVGRLEPVDAGTRFAIGSTTKAMVAVALGILVDEGAVAWDAPVITYLPWFRVADPWLTRELAVRDLLTHRAGFPHIDQIWTNPGFTAEQLRVSAELGRTGTLAHRQYDSFMATWTDDIGGAAALVVMPDGAGGVRGLRAFGAIFERVAARPPRNPRP